MWNIFIANNRDTRPMPMTSFWCLYCELWTYFTTSSSVFIVKFEQVNAGWEGSPIPIWPLGIGVRIFWIPTFLVQSCSHNFRSSNEIDINFKPLSNFDKRSKMTSKNNSDVIFKNNDVIIELVSFNCFGTIQKPNSNRNV